MKHKLAIFVILPVCWSLAWAQAPISSPQIQTSRLGLPVQTLNAVGVSGASLSIVGAPGQATWCYWASANFPIGSVLSSLGCVQNAANTLSVSNYVSVIPFSYPAGVTAIDILATSTNQAPTGACNCAVATGLTSGGTNHQSNSLSPYTVSILSPQSFRLWLTNEVVGTGATHLMLRNEAGSLVADLSVSTGGGSPVTVNGSGTLTSANLNNTTPAAGGGFLNCTFQASGANVSLECPSGNTSSTFALGNAPFTVNGQSCTLGGTCAIPFSTNGSANTSVAGLNFVTSTTNSAGLTITPSNPATTQEKLEVTGTVVPGSGGTGVANTASLTLGSANVNLATLGTGLVKNTTTTGALSNGASADVVGLFTGCSGTQYLGADGACHAAGTGTVGPGTTGALPKFTGSSTIGNSLVTDNGVTLSYPGTGGVASSGSFTSSSFTQGQPIGVNSAGTLNSSPTQLDVQQFASSCIIGANADACIAAAIAAIPANSSRVLDVSGLGSTITLSANPFVSLQSTIGLANPLKTGVLRFNANQTVTTNGPIVVPTGWKVEALPNRWAINGSGPVFIPGPSYPPCWGIAAPCNTAVEVVGATTSAPTNSGFQSLFAVTPASGTPFTSSMLQSHFGVCVSASTNPIGATGAACGNQPLGCAVAGCATGSFAGTACNSDGSGSGGNFPCRAFGLIVGVNLPAALPNGCGSSNCLLVSGPQAGSAQNPIANTNSVNYVIFAPVVTLGDFGSSAFNQGIQWIGGSIQTGLTQNLATGGAAPVATANYNSQEESYFAFTQNIIQGTGQAVGQDLELADFNSGDYNNNIITASGNCNPATILLVNRGDISSSYLRPWWNSTLTGSPCNSGAGVNVAVDWETGATLGPGVHFENGTGSPIDVDANDAVTCPVFCPMAKKNIQNAEFVDLNSTTGTPTLLKIGGTANAKGYTVRRLRVNNGTLLNDTLTGCSTAFATEPSLELYITNFANGVPTIAVSSSVNSTCRSILPPPINALASLPACSATTEGLQAVATNCNAACTVGGTCAVGGTTHCQLYCNSTPAYLETGR